MKTPRTLLILGIWIAILPYLGFPYSWKKILLTLSGLAIAYVAYLLYKKELINIKNINSLKFDNFSENSSFRNDTHAKI
ncbi:MAG: hypothetical protein V4504_00240 [Patescibacteria group bacterium]